jgi:hypothetical protein
MAQPTWVIGGRPVQRRFRAQIYCFDDGGRLSLTDPQDVFAADIDEAANKVTGGGVKYVRLDLQVGSEGVGPARNGKALLSQLIF